MIDPEKIQPYLPVYCLLGQNGTYVVYATTTTDATAPPRGSPPGAFAQTFTKGGRYRTPTRLSDLFETEAEALAERDVRVVRDAEEQERRLAEKQERRLAEEAAARVEAAAEKAAERAKFELKNPCRRIADATGQPVLACPLCKADWTKDDAVRWLTYTECEDSDMPYAGLSGHILYTAKIAGDAAHVDAYVNLDDETTTFGCSNCGIFAAYLNLTLVPTARDACGRGCVVFS